MNWLHAFEITGTWLLLGVGVYLMATGVLPFLYRMFGGVRPEIPLIAGAVVFTAALWLFKINKK